MEGINNGAQERLHPFRVDLCKKESFDFSIHGCHSALHVATPMVFGEYKDLEVIVNTEVINMRVGRL